MRRMLLALALSVVLAGCSSGGGTSGGGSTAGLTAGTTGLTIIATLTPDTFSSDTVASDCTVPPDGEIEQRLTSDNGSVTITIRDNSLVSTGTEKGVLFTSYTVNFNPVSAGAPALSSRTQGQNLAVLLGDGKEADGTVSVVLVELDTTKPEFRAKNTTGSVFTYSISVVFRGTRVDTGEIVSVTATAPMELGDFCDAG
jgi:hypothetical protein